MNVIILMAMFLGFIAVMLGITFEMLLGSPFGIMGFMGGFILLLGSILMIGFLKSPMWTFMSAAYAGRPLLQIARKDGLLAWERVKGYADGMLQTKNYGIYMIAPKDPGWIEKKSGAKIYRVSDGLGNTLSLRAAKVVKFLYDRFGMSDPKQIEYTLKNWHRCYEKNDKTNEVCEWEGVPKQNPVIEKDEDGEEKIVSYTKHCVKCDSENLKLEFPEMYVPIYETLDHDAPMELFYPAALHPDKVDAFTHLLIKANERLNRNEVIKFISIGLTVMFILIGVAVLFTVLPTGGLTAASAGSVVI